MHYALWILKQKIEQWTGMEDGQDLVEYALLVALVSLAATAGMRTLASDISTSFSTVGSTLTVNVS